MLVQLQERRLPSSRSQADHHHLPKELPVLPVLPAQMADPCQILASRRHLQRRVVMVPMQAAPVVEEQAQAPVPE